ncbi:MAG: hypothetical protein IIT68_03490 [Treponema sp.]|nr:hypothetical protein [Treponema sp.]
MEEKQSAQQAFSSFAKQMERFVASGETERPKPLYPKPTLQQRIIQNEQAFTKQIIDTYQKFLKPQDQETVDDQQQLLTAHKLYVALDELNKTTGNHETYLHNADLVCPLTQKNRYVTGGEFIYLQVWFEKEGGTTDCIPELQKSAESTKLIFVPAEEHVTSPREKRIRDTILSHFYPAKE